MYVFTWRIGCHAIAKLANYFGFSIDPTALTARKKIGFSIKSETSFDWTATFAKNLICLEALRSIEKPREIAKMNFVVLAVATSMNGLNK